MDKKFSTFLLHLMIFSLKCSYTKMVLFGDKEGRILTDVSMVVDTDNDNISFLECKIYGRNMVDKGENFEENTSGKTTIWMHSSGNQLEWVLLLGCYNLSTLNELNFINNTVEVDLTSSSQLQECITLCNKLDHMRRYFGLQDNMCFCYENNDVTIDSDCVPHKCKGGSDSLCGTTNESVVLYYRGEFVKNYQERLCGENIKTSNNKDKRCQDDLSYLCTENKESTNCSGHKPVMWFEDRRNSTNRCLSTSNDIPITHILPKENATMYQMGQFTCEIFDLMNLTSIEIASSCIKAANFIEHFTTESYNWNTSHLLQCSIPDNLIVTTPSTGLYNNKNTNCSLQNCIIYIIIGLAVIVTLVVLVSVVVCKCRKKTKAANRELAPEEIYLNTIRTCDRMEQSKAVYDQIKPSVVPTDTFAGSVYDSVASVHKMLDKLKK